jgi:F-type H+-transporting ATPase subunit b
MRAKYLAGAIIALGASLGLQDTAWCSAGGSGGPPWGDFLLRLLNFSVMVGILIWLLKKPAANFFSSRRDTIQKTLDDLEKKKKEAEQHCAEYRAKLAALDRETESIVAEYVQEGEAEKEKIIQEAKKQAEYVKKQAAMAINQEIRAARESLQDEIAELSATAAEDILKKNIKFADQERLIHEFTTKVVEAK